MKTYRIFRFCSNWPRYVTRFPLSLKAISFYCMLTKCKGSYTLHSMTQYKNIKDISVPPWLVLQLQGISFKKKMVYLPALAEVTLRYCRFHHIRLTQVKYPCAQKTRNEIPFILSQCWMTKAYFGHTWYGTSKWRENSRDGQRYSKMYRLKRYRYAIFEKKIV